MDKKAELSNSRGGRQGRVKKGGKESIEEPPEIKEKEEEPDKYYAPFSDYSLSKK